MEPEPVRTSPAARANRRRKEMASRGRTAIEWFCEERISNAASFDAQLLGGRMDRECARVDRDQGLSQIYRGSGGAQVLLLIDGAEADPSFLALQVRSLSKKDRVGLYS